jgi:membrane peptidoglycan carboxypeptidase
VADLQSHAAQFETTLILDRNGDLLYEILDPQAGRRTYVPLSRISPFLVAATIATEDSAFYSNPGFDPLAIARAVWQNLQEGGTASGASTITRKSLATCCSHRKNAGAHCAAQGPRDPVGCRNRPAPPRRHPELIQPVLRRHLAYGIEAAAQTYFGVSAAQLTLGQASFLAGLVQAPSVYDVFTNREATLERQRQVLVLMVNTSTEQGCIFVSNAQQPLCITPEAAGAASAELVEYEFKTPEVQIRFPHWVNYVRAELEARYDPQTIFRSGFRVFTTLDPALQRQAENIVSEQIGVWPRSR